MHKKLQLIFLCFISWLFCLESITAQKLPDLIPYRKGKKWGYCDSNKKLMIACKYDRVKLFKGQFAEIELNGRIRAINKKGEIVLPKIDTSNVYSILPLEIGDVFWIVDKDINAHTHIIVDFNGHYYTSYTNNLVEIDYYYDKYNNPFMAEFKEIGTYDEYKSYDTYKSRLITRTGNTIMDYTIKRLGQEKLTNKYTHHPEDGYLCIKIQDSLGKDIIINELGIQLNYNFYDSILRNRDKSKRIRKDPPYFLGAKILYSHWWVELYNDLFIVSNNLGKFGLLDENGHKILPLKYDYIIPLLTANDQYTYEKYAIIKLNGQSGLINRKGKIIVRPVYIPNISFPMILVQVMIPTIAHALV